MNIRHLSKSDRDYNFSYSFDVDKENKPSNCLRKSSKVFDKDFLKDSSIHYPFKY